MPAKESGRVFWAEITESHRDVNHNDASRGAFKFRED